MSNTKTAEGQRVHFLRATTVRLGTTMASGAEVFQRGAELTLTADILEASRDRNGDSWLERELGKGDESETLRTGPWPAETPTWRRGSVEWATAREKARTEAWKLTTEEEQVAALHAVEREFGGAPMNRSLQTQKGAR